MASEPRCAARSTGPRVEPAGGGGRQKGMVRMPVRTVMTGTLLVVTAMGAAACGGGGGGATDDGRASGPPPVTGVTAPPPSSSAPSSPASSAPDMGGATAATTPPPGGSGGRTTPPAGAPRSLYFATSVHPGPNAHGVLRNRGELDRFAGQVARSDAEAAAAMRASAARVDFSRSVLVGWTTSTGCSRAASAGLAVAGNRLELLVRKPSAPAECLVPYRLTTLFQAPAGSLPAHPVFTGG